MENDKIFIEKILGEIGQGATAGDSMKKFSTYIEEKMVIESKETNVSRIDEKLLSIWEKIQNNEVNKTFQESGKKYTGEEFVNDLKSY